MKGAAFLLIMIVFFATFEVIHQPFAMEKGGAAMKLASSAFDNGDMIPPEYTCDGADVSPPLEWDSVPPGTKSLALICDDPDAPMGTWVHWVYYDIPIGTKSFSENIAPEKHPANGGKQGTNDFNKIGYGGPCPPGGTHRYYFKLYALDVMLDLTPGATKKQLLEAIENHVLDTAQLMGKYKR